MDLPTVKASVKSWEKAFKALHKRDPTKDDIKRDSSGIGEHLSSDSTTNSSRAIFAIPKISEISYIIPVSISGWSSVKLADRIVVYVTGQPSNTKGDPTERVPDYTHTAYPSTIEWTVL